MPKKPIYFSRGFLSEDTIPKTIEDYFDKPTGSTIYERAVEQWERREGAELILQEDGQRTVDHGQETFYARKPLEHMYVGTRNVYCIFDQDNGEAFVGIETPGKDLLPYSVRRLLSLGVHKYTVYESVIVEDAVDLKAAIVADLKEMDWTVIQAIERGAISL